MDVEFQGDRLVFARERRQRSQSQVAAVVELSVRTIQRYEHNEETPSSDVAERISGYLGFPIEFFYDPRPLPQVTQSALSFRGYSKIRPRLRDNAVAVAQLAVCVHEYLATIYELPGPKVPDLSAIATTPVEAAQLLRSEWSLGLGPIPNVVHLLEHHGVRVFSLAEDVADVDAFCFWHQTSPFVILNQLKSGERGRFDGAHELAHLVLHRHVDFKGKDVEREADQFAAELLAPSDALVSQLPLQITLDTVFKLKRYWKVSAMAMVRRLKDLGRLSDWVYRSMCIQLTKVGYRDAEPDGVAREVSSVLSDILASDNERLPIAALANELRLRTSDLSPLVFGLPYSRNHLRLVGH